MADGDENDICSLYLKGLNCFSYVTNLYFFWMDDVGTSSKVNKFVTSPMGYNRASIMDGWMDEGVPVVCGARCGSHPYPIDLNLCVRHDVVMKVVGSKT